MKRVIQFHKAFIPTTIFSLLLIAAGLTGYFLNGGFNLGVDFQAGLQQEVQLAPSALSLTYAGKGTASLSFSKGKLEVVISGTDVEKATHSFPFATYTTVGSLVDAMAGVEGLTATAIGDRSAASATLIQSSQQNPQLGSTPAVLHYLAPGAAEVSIEKVRASIASISGVSVQSLGTPDVRRFLIRVEDEGSVEGFAKTINERITSSLQTAFGAGEVAVLSSNYVGSRFSSDLTNQVFMLVSLTLLVILAYCSFRFRPRYAFGAVLAILHDGLIMVAFIACTKMEFTTSTIAAILTILGYSINDTIVIFDRIREDVNLYPDDSFVQNMNRAITETLGRTFITTITTLLAVVALFVFTTGGMKDFALALIIGMISGIYSTIFIASAFVYFCDVQAKKKKAKKLAVKAPAYTKA